MQQGTTSRRSTTYRVVLIGNSHVGKTSIIQRLVNKEFCETYTETIGAAYFTWTNQINDKNIILQIWDTAGQEKYQSLGPIYYRNSSAAIAVYDETDNQSFLALKDWMSTFRASALQDAKIFIVGNKQDLENREVDEIVAENFARETNCEYFSVSAKTGVGIERLFQCVSKILAMNGQTVMVPGKPLGLDDNQSKSSCGC